MLKTQIGEKNLSSIDEKRKELRNFGFIIGFIFTGIGLFPLIKGNDINNYFFAAGLILLVFAALLPSLLSPFYRVWMRIGHLLGKVNSFILMSIIFYFIVTPMKVLLLIFSKQKKFSYRLNSQSNWIKRKSEDFKDTMRRQF